VLGFCQSHQSEKMSEHCATLQEYVELWQEVTQDIAMKAAKSPYEIGAASVDYLMLSGYITLAYMWIKMAKTAQTAQTALDSNADETDFYQAKLQTAEFYFERILPKAHGHLACLGNGAKSLMTMKAEHFQF
jgi:hypothetical protein